MTAFGEGLDMSEMVAVPLTLKERDRLVEIGLSLCHEQVTDAGSFLTSIALRWDLANSMLSVLDRGKQAPSLKEALSNIVDLQSRRPNG